MPVNLSKGEKTSLKGERVSLLKRAKLEKLIVGMGWDLRKDYGAAFDLDVEAFLLGSNGKVPAADEDFVFYNNMKHPSGSVTLSGDNRDGAGEGDDEWLSLELSKIPAYIESICFTVTIHEAEDRKQNFGMVKNAYIRVVNEETNVELIRYDLGEDFSCETAIVVGKLYRANGGWEFEAVGTDEKGGLEGLCYKYGVY